MKDAIAHADRYFNGEPWVLGDQVAGNIDRAALSAGLRDRYYSDFAKQWRTYIKSASVVRYAGLKDATAKLALLSGNQSPLLELFSLASTNTAVDDPALAGIFQPVQAVVPPGSTDRFVAPPNQNYMNALLTIQTSLETIANQPGAPSDAAAAQTVNNATQAKVNTRQMAQSFRIDAEGHIEASVQKLLEDPITYLDAMLKSVDAAELNAGGKSLCGSLRPRAQQVPVQFQRHHRSHAGRRECAVPQARRNALDVLRPEAPKGARPPGHAVRAQPRFQSDGESRVPQLLQCRRRLRRHAVRRWRTGPAFLLLPEARTQRGRPDAEPARGWPDAGLHCGRSGGFKKFTWQGSGAHEAMLSVRFGNTDLGFARGEGLWAAFHLFQKANQSTATGAVQLLEWITSSGKGSDAIMLPSGKPLTVRLSLDMASAPPLFQRGYLAHMTCVADIAK